MQLQPKTAIAFRNAEERIVLQKVLSNQGIDTSIIDRESKGRAYICPEEYHSRGCVFLEWNNDPEDFTIDKDDPFEWTYLEVSDVLHNLIISERRKKNVT